MIKKLGSEVVSFATLIALIIEVLCRIWMNQWFSFTMTVFSPELVAKVLSSGDTDLFPIHMWLLTMVEHYWLVNVQIMFKKRVGLGIRFISQLLIIKLFKTEKKEKKEFALIIWFCSSYWLVFCDLPRVGYIYLTPLSRVPNIPQHCRWGTLGIPRVRSSVPVVFFQQPWQRPQKKNQKKNLCFILYLGRTPQPKRIKNVKSQNFFINWIVKWLCIYKLLIILKKKKFFY